MLGYGYWRWDKGIKGGEAYMIMIYDYAGEVDQDFTLTMYAEKE